MHIPTTPYIWPANTKPAFAPKPLDASAFDQYTRGCVNVCADIIPFDRARKALVLARRSIKPQQGGAWYFGGRRVAGEAPAEAAVRHFKIDTGLEIAPERLVLLNIVEFMYPEREQEPKNVSRHDLSHTFGVELTDAELDVMRANLRPSEYVPGTLGYFDWDALQADGVHPILPDVWQVLFGVAGK